jgi:hypothetical protein
MTDQRPGEAELDGLRVGDGVRVRPVPSVDEAFYGFFGKVTKVGNNSVEVDTNEFRGWFSPSSLEKLQRPTEAVLTHEPGRDCAINRYSSAMCERGTKGCSIDHRPEPASTPPIVCTQTDQHGVACECCERRIRRLETDYGARYVAVPRGGETTNKTSEGHGKPAGVAGSSLNVPQQPLADRLSGESAPARAYPSGPWRAGVDDGRLLYCGEELVGMIESSDLAAAIVKAMNERWTVPMYRAALP